MHRLCFTLLTLALALATVSTAAAADRPNILIL
jgi:hypothetical protein